MLVETYKDPSAPCIALLLCYIKQFGTEALEFDPSLVKKEVEEKNGIELSDLNSDKLNAAIEVLTSDTFENNWNVFETCCHLFSNVPVDASIVVPLDVEEIVNGVVEAHLIKHESLDYRPDINLYVGKIFYDYGFSKAPDIFPTAIIPKCPSSDNSDKNKALTDLFHYRLSKLMKYVEKVS